MLSDIPTLDWKDADLVRKPSWGHIHPDKQLLFLERIRESKSQDDQTRCTFITPRVVHGQQLWKALVAKGCVRREQYEVGDTHCLESNGSMHLNTAPVDVWTMGMVQYQFADREEARLVAAVYVPPLPLTQEEKAAKVGASYTAFDIDTDAVRRVARPTIRN